MCGDPADVVVAGVALADWESGRLAQYQYPIIGDLY
jgi:hypothetical protein